MTPRTALGIPATAAHGPRQLQLASEAHPRSHVLPLLALAALLLAAALGVKAADATAPMVLPTQLTSYELHQLEEIRYLLWLDQSRPEETETR